MALLPASKEDRVPCLCYGSNSVAQLRERISQLREQIQGLDDQVTAKGREIKLISEELVEIGYAERVRGDSLVMCEHYRTEEKLFCFRSKIPVNPSSPDASAIALQWLLAYEAAFRRLGDMDAGGGD